MELETDLFFFPIFWLLQEFATSLRNRVSSVSEMPKIRTLTFVLHACKVLEQARKVKLDNRFINLRLIQLVSYAFLKVIRCHSEELAVLQQGGDRKTLMGAVAPEQGRSSCLPFCILTVS